jgi:peptidoglycan/LPS O-acetylase OafA/YrhL
VSDQTRVPELDGARGLVALIVVLGHSVIFGGLGEVIWNARPMSSFSAFDQAAVALLWPITEMVKPCMSVFFVLSSFLITGILRDTKGRDDYFSNFYARRMLRILPLYYFSLVAVIVASLALSSHGPQVLNTQLWFWSFTSNFLLAGGWESAPSQLHHYWSLAVEEQFYLVWPLVVLALSLKQLRMSAVFMILGATAFRVVAVTSSPPNAAYVSTPARLDELAIGALLAIQWREPGGLRPWAAPASLLLTVLAPAVATLILWRGTSDALLSTVGHAVYALFAGALICHLLTSRSALQRFFARPSLRFLGKHSYALYIVHQPIATLLFPALGLNIWRLRPFAGFVWAGQLAITTLLVASSVGLALLSWQFLEGPFLRLKSRFPRTETPRPAPNISYL